MVRIKFNREEDTIKGSYLLMSAGRVHCLPNDIFEVSQNHLEVLDKANIPYEILNDNLNYYETIRNSHTVKL